MSKPFRALGDPNYRKYFAGGLVSNLGTWMQRIAQDWLLLQLTGSGTALGIATALQFLPVLLFTPHAGVMAERVSRRGMLLVTQAIMGSSALLLGGLAVSGHVQAWHVLVAAFVLGMASAFDAPARHAFVSDLVAAPDVPSAVGLNAASFNLARLLGPAISGGGIAALGGGVRAAGWIIVVNGVSYAAVIWALRLMEPKLLRTFTGDEAPRGGVLDALRYVRSRQDLVLLMIVSAFVGGFGVNFQLMTALMVTNVFHRGASAFGVVNSTIALGSVLAALAAARRRDVSRHVVTTSAITFGGLAILTGLAPSFTAFLAIAPVLGFLTMLCSTASTSRVQLFVTRQYRSRVLALYLMVYVIGAPLGAPVLGWVSEEFGARWTLIGSGGVTVLGVTVAFLAVDPGSPFRRRAAS